MSERVCCHQYIWSGLNERNQSQPQQSASISTLTEECFSV